MKQPTESVRSLSNVSIFYLMSLMFKFCISPPDSILICTWPKPFSFLIANTGDSDGGDGPMSFLASTLNLYSRPGMMLTTVNLLLKRLSATVLHVRLKESRMETM